MNQVDIDRFWSRVDRSGECWLWTGSVHRVDAWGYGRIRIEGKTLLVHRLSYLLAYGNFPDDKKVLHRCDNPRCVRPDHLFLGTHADNVADRNRKGRQARGEANNLSRLTAREVRFIREQVASGVYQIDLARMFGVDRRTIGRIVHRQIWSDLDA